MIIIIEEDTNILSYLPFFSLPEEYSTRVYVARKLFFKTTPFLSSTINFEQIIPFSLLIDNKTARKRVPSKFRKNLVIDFCTPFPCLKRRRRNKREMARPSLRKRHFKSYVHGHDSYAHRRFLRGRGKVSGWRGRGKNASRRGMMSKCETA